MSKKYKDLFVLSSRTKTDWVMCPPPMPLKLRYEGPEWIAKLIVSYCSKDRNKVTRKFTPHFFRLLGKLFNAKWIYAESVPGVSDYASHRNDE